MTSSPAPDLDELERLRLAVEDPGWVLPITALVPMTQQQTEYASALVNAAPALLQEVRAARAAAAESGRLREALLRWTTRVYQLSPSEAERREAARDHDALLATPPAPSDHGALDVGVIAQALHFADTGLMRGAPPDCADCEDKAAEYARLAAPSVSPEPAAPEGEHRYDRDERPHTVWPRDCWCRE